MFVVKIIICLHIENMTKKRCRNIYNNIMLGITYYTIVIDIIQYNTIHWLFLNFTAVFDVS